MIISPKIGCPYFIQKDAFTVLTASKHKSQINDISLLLNGTEIPLNILKIQHIRWSQVPEIKYCLKYNPELKYLFSVRVALNDNINKRQLYDLKVQNDISYNAVYVVDDLEQVKVAHITDTHVAHRWDKIEDDITRKLSENSSQDFVKTTKFFIDNYINPNKSFKKFISKANKLHREKKLDLVILTGDLVDYAYDEDWNNYQLFVDIVRGKENNERLEVPLFTVPGNHDHRSAQYNLQIYGMHHVGINRIFKDLIIKELELNQKIPYKPRELNNVIVRRKGMQSPIGLYYSMINPYRNYKIDLGPKARLIGVCSGYESFLSLKLYFLHPIQILKSIFGNRVILTGFDKEDIDHVSYNLSHSKTNIIAIHAPLFGTHDKYLNSIDPKFKLLLECSERKFFTEMNKRKLNVDIALSNRLEMMKAMLQTSAPVVLLHGHIHLVRSFLIDKTNLSLKFFKWTKLKDFRNYYIQLGTPAMGHIRNLEDKEHSIGFRTLTLDSDNISSKIEYSKISLAKYCLEYVYNKKNNTYSINIEYKNNGKKECYIMVKNQNIFNKLDITSVDFNGNEIITDETGSKAMRMQTSQHEASLHIKKKKRFKKTALYFAILDGEEYRIFPKALLI